MNAGLQTNKGHLHWFVLDSFLLFIQRITASTSNEYKPIETGTRYIMRYSEPLRLRVYLHIACVPPFVIRAEKPRRKFAKPPHGIRIMVIVALGNDIQRFLHRS
jgi:hypothetical protein